LKFSENLVNGRPVLIDPQNEAPHKCQVQPQSQSFDTIQPGVKCWNNCGKFIVSDESLPDLIRVKENNREIPEPKLREVVSKLDIHSVKHYDIKTGTRHTKYRCMMLKDGYDEKAVEILEHDYFEKHQWYLAALASLFNPPNYRDDLIGKGKV
jgi:hypothetical protein